STKTSGAMPATPRAAVKIRNGRMGIHWATASWSTTPATISTATKRYSSTEHQARHAPTMTKLGSTHRTYQGGNAEATTTAADRAIPARNTGCCGRGSKASHAVIAAAIKVPSE